MTRSTLQQGKILIVDDEKANIRLLEIVLEQAGYTNVYSTHDSRQSLSLFRSIQPDLVLLDLAMPYLDGFVVMQQLQQEMRDNSVPILVLTADTVAATKHKALKEGASDFLNKPLDEVEVLLRIHNLMEARLHNVLLESRVRERTLDLENSHEQLRNLTAGLTLLIEEERTHIAREVHDVLGQALTGLKMDLSWLNERLPSDAPEDIYSPIKPIRQKIHSMLDIIDSTIQSVQRIASQLRPALLDDFGLEAGMEWQIQEFQERTTINCDFMSSLDDMELSPAQTTAVFRIFQEVLTNIVRHAAANRVNILLEENAGFLMLEVQDNGRGMNERRTAVTNVKSLGLLGMQERARLVGGEVTIKSRPDHGTTVTVCIPLIDEGISRGFTQHVAG